MEAAKQEKNEGRMFQTGERAGKRQEKNWTTFVREPISAMVKRSENVTFAKMTAFLNTQNTCALELLVVQTLCPAVGDQS